jgi:UDP-glucose 4-epimerase
MKILLVGASSFIGNNLFKSLSKFHEVWGTYYNSPINGPQKYSLRIDVNDPNWLGLIPKIDYDVVIWAIQSRFYRFGISRYSEIFSVNCSALQKFLDWLSNNNIKKFIYMSSGSVYKKRKIETPFKESDAIDFRSPYGVSKFIGELLCSQYASVTNVLITRLFTVYGPKQSDKIIPVLIQKIKNGEVLSLNQGKGMVFSPIFISDVVDIFSNLLISSNISNNSIVNVAGSEIVDLRATCELIAKFLGVTLKVSHSDGAYTYAVGDMTKLHNLMPSLRLTSLNVGLRKTVLESL